MNVTSSYSTTSTSFPFLMSWSGSGGEEAAWWAWLLAEAGVAVVMVAGDVSLLMLFFTRKLLGQSTNILVFSVAVADLIMGLLVFPLDVLQRLLNESSGYTCKAFFYLSNVSKTAVIYTLTMLALERITATLTTSFRILSPGRCLFFSSLTWFFAAAYNIWSMVLYDARILQQGVEVVEVEEVEIVQGASMPWSFGKVSNVSVHVCFSSTRFQGLVDVFVVLDLLVTFLLPVFGSLILFAIFWKKRDGVRAPGRPYRSSTSIIVFAFALLVSFALCHLPLEVAALHVRRDDVIVRGEDFAEYKLCQLTSFTRGLWDVLIFGAFRHYVCRKERALAVFRCTRYGREGDRGGGGGGGGDKERVGGAETRTRPMLYLAVPTFASPPSTSLLDSDQEVTVTPHPSSVSDL